VTPEFSIRPGAGPPCTLRSTRRATQRDFRDNVEESSPVLIAAPSGAQIPISEVAKISFSRGPAMVRDEDGQLTGYVYINLNTTDYGDFVDQANDAGPKSASGKSVKWAALLFQCVRIWCSCHLSMDHGVRGLLLRLSSFLFRTLNPQLSIDSFHRAPMLKV
jgi:hypothetical protein